MRFQLLLRIPGILLAVLLAGCGGGGPALRDRPPEPEGPPFAELVRVGEQPPLTGDLVAARPGDWLLRNDRLAVVITAVDHPVGFSWSGGVLVDAAPTGGRDILQEIFTYFDDTFPRQAIYETVEPDDSVDSLAAGLVARGHDSGNEDLEVETRFHLAPGAFHVEITTRITNRGTDTIPDFELGDVIEQGRWEVFAPGPGRDLTGVRTPIPYLLGYGEGTAYAYVNPAGNLDGPHGHLWSDPIVKTVTILPGETATYRRMWVVRSGSPSGAAEVARTLKGDPEAGHLVAVVRDGRGHPVEGAWAEAIDSTGQSAAWGVTDYRGITSLPVTAGEYTLRVSHPRRGVDDPHTVSVRPGYTQEAGFTLAEPAELVLEAEDDRGDPSPAKWTFRGRDETPDPRLGSDHDPRGAGPCVFTPRGEETLEFPPGKYEVVVSRGPGYQVWRTEFEVRPGRTVRLEATLEAVPIPAGWVAADFHVHAIPSADCNVGLAARAEGLVCEGIDWFAASDHGVRTDFSGVLDTLDLAAPLHALISEEVTTAERGHFGVFPFASGGPGTDIRGIPIPVLFDYVRTHHPGALIQVNHPRAGRNGYLDYIGFSAADSLDGREPVGRLDFDLMEIVNGKALRGFDTVWKDWAALLRRGYRVTGVGNSDSHHLVGQEAGYPRNYIFLGDGDPADPRALVDAVRAGRVVVSSGPFIEFTIDGEEIGATLQRSAGTVTVHVRVLAPAWVDVREVRVLVNGEVDSVFLVAGRDRVVRFDEDVDLRLRASGFVQVVVSGEASLDPVVPPDLIRGSRELSRPLAFTNPIWIEIASARR